MYLWKTFFLNKGLNHSISIYFVSGVVLSHNNLLAQVSSLVEMWHWNTRDVILHALPLTHIHGVVNALMCPFAVGAK